MTPPTFDLGLVFKDSAPSIPLIFVLTTGADPLNNHEQYAEYKQKTVKKVSLGQGQGPKAEKLREEGNKKGTWVVPPNCHLTITWPDRLATGCR